MRVSQFILVVWVLAAVFAGVTAASGADQVDKEFWVTIGKDAADKVEKSLEQFRARQKK